MPSVGNFMTIIVAVVSPTSVGSIKLASGGADTFTQPLIDYGLLSTDFDVQAMLQAITDSETFIATDPFHRDGFLIAPFGGFANATTTQQKVDYMRANADTVHHPIGSAMMGKDSSSAPLGGEGVTDPRLRVRGVKGLRVVDASVLVRASSFILVKFTVNNGLHL
jgi:choline dehydrogenase-like flavoprotein